MAMADMNHKEKDRNVVLAFKEEGLKMHVSRKNEKFPEGQFLNGKALKVFDDFFIIDDVVYGPTNVFFYELNKPVEEFVEVKNG